MAEIVKLFYEEWGRGPALVLLHGFPLNHTIWNPLLPFLTHKARVIAPDMRGHGKSPAPEGTYSMELIAADVLGLLDELGIERVILAGHSMGGYAALAFAAAYPRRLAGLALVASSTAADLPERRQGRFNLAQQVRDQGVGVVAEGMPEQLTALPGLQNELRQIILAAPRQGVIGALKGMAERPDRADVLAGFEQPVRILAGEKDALIPLERAQGMAAGLKNGRLVVVPNAGHMPMMETPEFTAGALLELI